MDQPAIGTQTVSVDHVRIETSKPFAAVRQALEALLPRLDTGFLTSLRLGQTEQAADELGRLPMLSIFQTRDHGDLLRAAGVLRHALQYEIGNPLTATRMTRYVAAAALYAPLRVVLYETQDGRTVFEYDRPSSQFGQYGDDRVTEVAHTLDYELEKALLDAASSQGRS